MSLHRFVGYYGSCVVLCHLLICLSIEGAFVSKSNKGIFTETAYLEDLSVEYERFFEVSLDMLCISSFDGHFKKVNPAFEEILGFSSEELCTKSYLDFIHPDDIEITIKEVEKQLKLKQAVFSFENRYRCKDGSYKWLSWKSAPVGNFMYAAARDITDMKKAKADLEQSNRDLESFSYSIAHDLRAPARSVINFASIVYDESAQSLSDTSKEYLLRVINAGKKMGFLIDGLLNLSKLAKQEVLGQHVNLSRMAKEICESLHKEEPKRNVKFVIAPNVTVNGDTVLLKAAMSSLISNSWKFTAKIPYETVIEFGETKIDDQRVFFVRDNGVGFDMTYVDKLFGVFNRLHSESAYEGVGIGLAVVQRIIFKHGGKVWAESDPEKKSTTFYFTL